MPDPQGNLPPMTLIGELSLSNCAEPTDEQAVREHHRKLLPVLAAEIDEDFRELKAQATR